jgi:hypothetical protein
MPPRRPDARTLLFEKIRTSAAKFVHVTGVPYTVERAPAATEGTESDNLWLTVEAPPFGRLRVVLNTASAAARTAGDSPNLRVGIVQSTWTEKPAPKLAEDNGQDYAKIEAAFAVTYQEMAPAELFDLLAERAKRAVRAEVWGELFARDTLGVRQVHSRRKSRAVPDDLRNRDGALKLYYADNTAELMLFKFEGQS